ncbi:MAG: HAD domain-containing protein [bacterium]
MIRILFLDFDGVLNNTAWFEARHAEWVHDGKLPKLDTPYNERDDLDPENLASLKDLLERVPGLQVVVSSSWRKGRSVPQLRELLSKSVWTSRVIGVTPSLESRLRFEEIRAWIENAPFKVNRFLALDDDTHDMHQLGDDFLHVDRRRGLTSAHVEKAVRHFLDP